mgnify:CR=1 FL=1
MIIPLKIKNLRKISLALFLLSLSALLGSLWLVNTLTEYNFQKELLSDKKINISQDYYNDKIVCSENIDDCRSNKFLNKLSVTKKLGDCFENNLKIIYKSGNKITDDISFFLLIIKEIII